MTHETQSQSNIVGMGAIGQALRPLISTDVPAVFFCVKAFDLSQALKEQAALWPVDIPFVTLTNGFIAPEIDACKSILGDRPVRWGMTTIGAAFKENGALQVYGDGAITAWGPFQSPLQPAPEPSSLDKPTAGELNAIGAQLGWTWQDDIVPTIRRKWLFNTVLNTMCGALRLSSNGKLLNHRVLAEAVLSEAYDLAKELWPARARDIEPLDVLRTQFLQLVQKTADNENSMARDARLGRRTESSFLAGMAQGRRGYDRLKTYHAVLARLG